MVQLGRVTVDDYIACVIRTEAALQGCPPYIALGIAMGESGFNQGALGDQAPGPTVVGADGTVYNPYRDPATGLYYCSLGLFQLNVCGGQGVGYDPRTLLIGTVNAKIGIHPITVAVFTQTAAGYTGEALLRQVCIHSGHPGLVDPNDPRVTALVHDMYLLIFNADGSFAQWPANNPALCAGAPPPPPPLGTWSEPFTPTTQDQAQQVIEAHFQRVSDLFARF